MNFIHQTLFLFQLNTSIVDTKNHERILKEKKHAKTSAFAVLCSKEVVFLKITPLVEPPNP